MNHNSWNIGILTNHQKQQIRRPWKEAPSHVPFHRHFVAVLTCYMLLRTITGAFSAGHQYHPVLLVVAGFVGPTTVITSHTQVLRRQRRPLIRRTMSKLSDTTPSFPPLIDVDCNLWHDDLASDVLLFPPSNNNNSTDTEETSNVDDTDNAWEASIESLLQRDAIQESNLVALLSPSSTLIEARKGIAFLQKRTSKELPIIRTTVGVHPYHVHDDDLQAVDDPVAHVEQTIQELLYLDNHHVTVENDGPSDAVGDSEDTKSHVIAAIGECGLDTTDGFPPLSAQLPLFELQVQLASQYKLPLFVHERGAFEECQSILQEHATNDIPILIHCFTGSVDDCRSYIDSGYFLSVSGYIFKTSPPSNDVEQPPPNSVVQCLQEGLIPLDRLMIETDAPYMGFSGCRELYVTKHSDYLQTLNAKKRKRLQNSIYPNVPSSLPLLLTEITHHINVGRQQRGEPILTQEQVATYTTNNANQFFQFNL